ncbi:MAG: FlgD immunoglobulin-like domain containing protein [Candidatus Eiseniibacteriota bacterium]
MVVTNHGSFAYDLLTGNAGLFYPKGSLNTVVFAAGPWIGAKVGGATRLATGEYGQEFVPGPMLNGTFLPDMFQYRNFKIIRGDTTSADYANWPAQDGAPVDSLGHPALLGDVMIWSVFNDADPSSHVNDSGGTAPLGVEVQQSTFAFNRPGPLSRTLFLKFKLLNKGGSPLDSTFVALWSDPDVGGYTDDLVGCDTTLSLGYCYNGTNADLQYGSTPPAVGFALLQGPGVTVSPGVTDTLGMTAFARYMNGTDPVTATEAYNAMSGLNTDGSPVHELDDPFQPITTFQVSGNPVAGTGWLDSSPSDRRLLLVTGPFAFAPGDTQEVVFAICVGQGTDRLSSITDLRIVQASAKAAYGAGFQLEPPTAVSATLLESDVRPDRVHLVGAVPQAATLAATVLRREEWGAWDRLGAATLNAEGKLQYDDATVTPGTRYGYRLVLRESSGEESYVDTWVEVPREGAPLIASLHLRTANPSNGAVRIDFGLPTAGSIGLEVFDIHGRRVATLASGPSMGGWHGMTWDGRDDRGRALASGIYLLRLETPAGAVVRKLAVAR